MTTIAVKPSTSFVWFDRPGRLRLDVTGPDRARCLNNLATNDIRRLVPGHGCEAFITSPQGKTLGFVTILATEDRLIVRSDVAARELLAAHFRKYGAFDDVEFEDVTARSFEILMTGTEVASRLNLDSRMTSLDHKPGLVLGSSVQVVRDDPTGREGWTILGDRGDLPGIAESLSAIAPEMDSAEFDSLRIAAGTPIFGRDITPESLPQEIGRDASAIHFSKGCYLGQETVARIDALGHVNKILRGIRMEDGPVPSPGSTLELGGKTVGSVTSSGYSEELGCPIGLAMIRVAAAEAGTQVEVVTAEGRGAATVLDLPMVRNS